MIHIRRNAVRKSKMKLLCLAISGILLGGCQAHTDQSGHEEKSKVK